MQYQKDLEKNGYAIIENVLSKKQIKEYSPSTSTKPCTKSIPKNCTNQQAAAASAANTTNVQKETVCNRRPKSQPRGGRGKTRSGRS